MIERKVDGVPPGDHGAVANDRFEAARFLGKIANQIGVEGRQRVCRGVPFGFDELAAALGIVGIAIIGRGADDTAAARGARRSRAGHPVMPGCEPLAPLPRCGPPLREGCEARGQECKAAVELRTLRGRTGLTYRCTETPGRSDRRDRITTG